MVSHVRTHLSSLEATREAIFARRSCCIGAQFRVIQGYLKLAVFGRRCAQGIYDTGGYINLYLLSSKMYFQFKKK